MSPKSHPFLHTLVEFPASGTVTEWKKVKGIRDAQTKEFFAYPLPLTDLDIWDDSNFEVLMSMEKDDPATWSQGGDHPVVEFKLRCSLSGVDDLGSSADAARETARCRSRSAS